jgi:4-carboxymuconolactone decarboxylase
MKDYILKTAALLLLSITSLPNMNAQEIRKTSQSLNAHQQSMARIAALTATGNIEQLKPELAKGLEVGMTVNEIKEALVQLYAYCGFPRSLNALNTFMAIVEERKSRGIKDVSRQRCFSDSGHD